jgi:hypothetical protein
MFRTRITEETAPERITAEQRAAQSRINENVGQGQAARIADNTAPRRR